jgi:phosphatidylglycerophosphatase A
MGLGYIPLAPGTFGALGGLICGCIVKYYTEFPNEILTFIIILFFISGVYCANKLIPEWGKDPSRIVIDEVVGMWIAMLFIPLNFISILASFIFFRLFDIFKPLFIRKAENIKGGWGVMLDDVVAGVYANILTQLVIYVCPI